jgi:hypothetical protein
MVAEGLAINSWLTLCILEKEEEGDDNNDGGDDDAEQLRLRKVQALNQLQRALMIDPLNSFARAGLSRI